MLPASCFDSGGVGAMSAFCRFSEPFITEQRRSTKRILSFFLSATRFSLFLSRVILMLSDLFCISAVSRSVRRMS